ncbi:MAG: Fur family transcriptional regulator [Opitutales bacterium]
MGKNFRDTKQRNAIRQVLEEADEPLSPKEILEAASKRTQSLGIATVYRYLRKMVDDQQVEQIELPGVRTCYMLPRHRNEPFLIDQRRQTVRRLREIELTLPEDSLPPDFELSRFEVLVYGRFADPGPDGSQKPSSVSEERPKKGAKKK